MKVLIDSLIDTFSPKSVKLTEKSVKRLIP
uniref:Uncharacterized protein n=1 Tax=Caudovirales sp. ct7964 TaxID=2825758 RepID=A0A8S5PEQ4_9CAUD|nr:MAG TPA: hypothetical protein [Caudovirales sp. ct7964]